MIATRAGAIVSSVEQSYGPIAFHLRVALGLFICAVSVVGAAVYTSVIRKGIPDDFFSYFVIGVAGSSVYSLMSRYGLRIVHPNAQSQTFALRGEQAVAGFLTYALTLFFVFFGISIAFEIITGGFRDSFMKQEFGDQLLPNSTFDGAYVVTAGKTVEMHIKSQQCFLDGRHAQLGDGWAAIIQRMPAESVFPAALRAAWRTEGIDWGMVIQSWRNVTCDPGTLAGKISFPKNVNSLVRVTMQLRMPTTYPRSNGYHSFANVTEDLSSEPFDVVVVPGGSAEEGQYAFRSRVTDLPIKISFVALGACLSSWIIMYYLWRSRTT